MASSRHIIDMWMFMSAPQPADTRQYLTCGQRCSANQSTPRGAGTQFSGRWIETGKIVAHRGEGVTRSHVSAQVAEMKVFERKCAALMVNNNTQPRSISRSILNHLRVFAWPYNGRCSSKREPR